MVTVSKLPFCIQLRNSYRSQAVMEADRFFFSEEEAWNCGSSSLTIEENDEIELLFHSSDRNARLYLDALYGIPAAQEIAVDGEGKCYCRPTEEYFYLYKSEDGYEPLCVDQFLITVVCENQTYYGTLEVRPKQMDIGEWSLMKKELEAEVRGLAKELVLRNQGFGTTLNVEGAALPEPFSKFLIIKNYVRPLTAAIMDIADKPRSQIITTYDTVAADKARIFDRETAKRYVRTGGAEATRRVPVKTVTYDIPENRMLKNMIATYEKALDEFIGWVEETNERASYMEFQQTACKLRKLSNNLKQKPWYKQVSGYLGYDRPHSFMMDARYNIIYQMDQELRRSSLHTSMKPKHSYAWKRSSLLYEIWCFVKVCQILGAEYALEDGAWDQAFGEQKGCPVLKSGTTIRFYNEKLELYVQYDQGLPQSKEQTDSKEPLYMVKMQNGSIGHNKPDITIHIYSRAHACYIGSLVIECKYRKMNSFWRKDSERSSIGQVQTYFNNARSEYLYHNMGKRFNCNPVHQVIVLTPDLEGNNAEDEEFNILIKSIKPSKTDEMLGELKQVLKENMQKALGNCRLLLGETAESLYKTDKNLAWEELIDK